MSGIRTEIKKLEVFSEAKESTLEMLEKHVKIRTVSKGSHLFFDKDQVLSMYGLISGCVALYKMNAMGEKKVIFLYKEGSILNEVILQEISASINCEVLEESRVLVISRTVLLKVMETDFSVNKKILDSMAVKIRRLYRQMKNTTNSMRGEKKLASKLWKLARDHGQETEDLIEIPMDLSITYLADMLGSKRETVSRQIKMLSEKNLIKMEKNKFFVCDMDRLKNFYDK